MHRIDHAHAKLDMHGPGKAGFFGGIRARQIPATTITSDIMNALQEEIARPIEVLAGSLTKADHGQLREIMLRMVLGTLTTEREDPSFTDIIYALAETNSRHIAVGASGGILTSTDGGKWTKIAPAASYSGAFRAITTDGNNTVIIAGENGAIQVSGATGGSWTDRAAAGGYTGTFRGAARIQGVSNAFLLCGDNGELQRTTNGGTTWTHIDSGTVQHLRALSRLGGASDRLFAIGAGGTAIISDDLGLSWSLVQTGGTDNLASIVQTPTGRLIAFSETGAAFVYSDDNGDTWTRVTRSGFPPEVHALAARGGLVVAAGRYGEISYSIDDGLTWKRLFNSNVSGTRFYAAMFARARLVLAGENAAIQRSMAF